MTAHQPVEHLHDRRTGQHLTFLQTSDHTNGELLAVQVRLEPGGAVPRHAHLRQDERVTVRAGALSVHLGRTQVTLSAGESCDVPRRRLHVVRNASDGETVFLLEVRPARRMESAMRMLFALTSLVMPLRRPARPRGQARRQAGAATDSIE